MVSSVGDFFLIRELQIASRQDLKNELSHVRVTLQVERFVEGGPGENFPDKIRPQNLSSDD